LFRIVFPVIRPGVLTGALFAFVMSFDEVVVAAFIGGYRTATLPKRMFENVRDETDPTVAAISTFLVLVSVALLIVVGYLNRRRIGVQKGG
jgi:putative spermidine/putrescine transport system permease protein